MANWASTTYVITGKEDDIKELYELINDFQEDIREPMEKDADKSWEGNIALALGEDIEGKYLRGFIGYMEFEGDTLTIDAEEAWGVTDFKDVLLSHYKDMRILFESVEWGDEYFVTNDVDKEHFSNRFAVYSIVDGDSNMEEFETEEEALKSIASKLEVDTITREGIEEWNKKHELAEDDADNCISFYEYKVVD